MASSMALINKSPHLFDNANYVIHYKNLNYFVGIRFQVTKKHYFLLFGQRPWLKPYIDCNTQKKAQPNNDFERAFLKLINSSVLGNAWRTYTIYEDEADDERANGHYIFLRKTHSRALAILTSYIRYYFTKCISNDISRKMSERASSTSPS